MGGAGGAGGSREIDAGATPDDAAPIDAIVVIDANQPDRVADAPAVYDACVPTGAEICDGIDNNCNGAIDEGNACRNGCAGVSHAGIGYVLCYGNGQQRSWQDASTDCTNRGMRLARIDSEDENAFIRKASLALGFGGIIWIGASDLNRKGTWAWTDGTQFWLGGAAGHTVGGQFATWDTREPDGAGPTEDCAAMFTNVEKWHDLACGARYAYVCKSAAP
jgi:hypothetical protein